MTIRRHEDPSAVVRNLFACQAAGHISGLRVQVGVEKAIDGAVLVRLNAAFQRADGTMDGFQWDVWPPDLPEVAEVLRVGAETLIDIDVRASWDACDGGGS